MIDTVAASARATPALSRVSTASIAAHNPARSPAAVRMASEYMVTDLVTQLLVTTDCCSVLSSFANQMKAIYAVAAKSTRGPMLRMQM